MKISKKEIRDEVLKKRVNLLPDEKRKWDEAILERIRPFFPEPGTSVYAYIGVRGESGTERIIDELLDIGCLVAVPKVSGRDMSFYYIKDRFELAEGTYGIPEPVDGCREATDLKALVITPGVGFAPDGTRIGYGAGYYDRFFGKEPDHLAVGICYDFQLFDEAESDRHDRKMSYIVTPTRTIDISGGKDKISNT